MNLSQDKIEIALEKLEADGFIRLFRITGDWYSIYCPFHNSGQERKPSCGVSLRPQYKNGQEYPAGLWHCFSCGASYSFDKGIAEIFKQKSVTTESLKWLQENVPGFNPQDIELDPLVPADLMSNVLNKYAAESLHMRFQQKQKFVSEQELASYRLTVPYMYERKLTDEVIARYDVGFDPNHIPPGRKKPLPCITFPVRDIKGNTLFFCRRSIEGKYFNYPQGVSKPVYGLYELPKDCKSVIVCESIINCLTCVTYGYNAVALMGTGNSYQITQLQRLGVKDIVICLDGDEAGRRGTEKLKKALKGTAFVWVMTVPEGEDINSCTREQFEAAYAARE